MSTTYVPRVDVRRPLISAWLVALVAVVVAFVALDTWALVDRYAAGERTATAVVDDLTAAITARDADAIAALYARDAVVVNARGTRYVGVEIVASRLAGARAYDARFERVAPVTTEGKFATTFIRYGDGARDTGTLLTVFQLDEGKIMRQWDFEIGVTSPFATRAIMP